MATKMIKSEVKELKTELVLINSIHEWKENPRKNDEAVPKIAELLKIHGQVEPLIVWRNNHVVYGGNTRLKAAKLLGWNKINVHFVDCKTEKKAIELGISLNKSSEWSEWDEKKLNKLTSDENFSFVNAGFLAGTNIKFEEQEVDLYTDKSKLIEVDSKPVKKSIDILSGHSDDYKKFLDMKLPLIQSKGFDIDLKEINNILMPFQKDIVRWSVKRGRCAIFSGTGTGKTIMQIEWGRFIENKTKKPVLILCPLAVENQTITEAKEKLNITIIKLVQSNQFRYSDCGIYIVNYEKLEHINVNRFGAVILDESSIIKNFEGSLRILILEKFAETQYKLCCTATPAPNDYMELGTHAEFLGVMKRQEMLSMYFVHDGARTSNWRLKGHAKDDFYKWLASWSVMFRSPRDLGYNDDSVKFFDLPKITYKQIIVDTNQSNISDSGITGRILKRQATVDDRINAVIEKVGTLEKNIPCVFWCDLNDESNSIASALNISEIKGSDPIEIKERILNDFSSQRIKRISTKPSMTGFGLNWQFCNIMFFIGLSDSFEHYYQAIRRIWRAGQKKDVTVYIVMSSIEKNVLNNIQRKESEFLKLQEEMIDIMAPSIVDNIKLQKEIEEVYKTATVKEKNYALYLGDCVDVVKSIKDESIDFSIFSPPFASLYTYSNSIRDMGNCVNHEQFFVHFTFLIKELYRVIRQGRLVSIHCMNLPTSKVRDGYIGLIDFRGLIIKAMQDIGFIYHSEVTIWKSPVTTMQRTKALRLLHKQLKKDSAMSGQGIPDYICTFRKPGENKSRITHTDSSFPVKGNDGWQEVASPVYIKNEDGTFKSSYDNPPPYFGVWMDINPSDTLQRTSVREYEDERHIAPLQLMVIERCLKLWSKPNDTVLSPFMGIGSEGVKSLEMNRKFVGVELKEVYFKQAKANIERIH